MDTNIEPIPETLESHLNVGAPFSWSQAKIEEQLEARKALCEQIFEEAGDDHDMRKVTVLKGDSSSKVKQLKQLNDDIKLLMGCRLVPHIGHPSGPDRAFGSGDGGGSFVEAIRRAKWDPVCHPASSHRSRRSGALQGRYDDGRHRGLLPSDRSVDGVRGRSQVPVPGD